MSDFYGQEFDKQFTHDNADLHSQKGLSKIKVDSWRRKQVEEDFKVVVHTDGMALSAAGIQRGKWQVMQSPNSSFSFTIAVGSGLSKICEKLIECHWLRCHKDFWDLERTFNVGDISIKKFRGNTVSIIQNSCKILYCGPTFPMHLVAKETLKQIEKINDKLDKEDDK